MRTHEREAAWREYANQLGRLNVAGESLETPEIDFKAGFDAACDVLAPRLAGGVSLHAVEYGTSSDGADPTDR